MNLPNDADKLEEVLALLKTARQLAGVLSCKADDLESLISVTQAEGKRLLAATIAGKTTPGTIPLILAEKAPPKPNAAR